MNSRHRPQGGSTYKIPSSSRHTATIRLIPYLPAVTIAAIAACSAQQPVPDEVSMQTPPKRSPSSVTRTEAPSPKSRSPTLCGFRSPAARSTRSASDRSTAMGAGYPSAARSSAMSVKHVREPPASQAGATPRIAGTRRARTPVIRPCGNRPPAHAPNHRHIPPRGPVDLSPATSLAVLGPAPLDLASGPDRVAGHSPGRRPAPRRPRRLRAPGADGAEPSCGSPRPTMPTPGGHELPR